MQSWTVIAAFEKDGWFLKRVIGSHNYYMHPTKPGILTIPHSRKDIPFGTLRSVEKQAGIELW